jgi:hypothetical protein
MVPVPAPIQGVEWSFGEVRTLMMFRNAECGEDDSTRGVSYPRANWGCCWSRSQFAALSLACRYNGSVSGSALLDR